MNNGNINMNGASESGKRQARFPTIWPMHDIINKLYIGRKKKAKN